MARKTAKTSPKAKKTVKATAAHFETKAEHKNGNGHSAKNGNGNAFAFAVPSLENLTADFQSRWTEGAERMRAAFGQFGNVGGLDQARASAEEVAEIWRDSIGRAGKSAREVNLQAISYAQGDLNRFFDAARALLGAKSVKEWTEIQTQFVRESVETQMRQSKELGELSMEAAREALAPITENVQTAMQKLRTR